MPVRCESGPPVDPRPNDRRNPPIRQSDNPTIRQSINPPIRNPEFGIRNPESSSMIRRTVAATRSRQGRGRISKSRPIRRQSSAE